MEPTPPPITPIVIPATGYTIGMYNALMAALASGAREVQYGDQRVAYQTPAQMRQTLAEMRAALGIGGNIRRRTPGFSKGLF